MFDSRPVLADAQVGLLLAEVEAQGGVFLLTADHGNADDMVQVRLPSPPIPLC